MKTRIFNGNEKITNIADELRFDERNYNQMLLKIENGIREIIMKNYNFGKTFG